MLIFRYALHSGGSIFPRSSMKLPLRAPLTAGLS